MVKNTQISVQTITDQHLTDFIRCPYRFYYTHIEKKKHPFGWRQAIQHVVNRVVYSYYQYPLGHRTPAKVLALIEKYWSKLELRMFDNKLQFYMAAAAITDGLMKNLSSDSNVEQPLFLYEKFSLNVKEVDADLSLTFDVAEWENSSFIVKKYLVDADEQMLKLYFHLIVIFSEKVFGIRPERIEVITLMDGQKHIFTPDEYSLENGISYLQLMKNLIEDSQRMTELYNTNECPSCPFLEVCEKDEQTDKKNKYLS
ncbi:hypothetical protein [Bacillus sp. J33]|uniref:hypothetical protein n=1 Tax=Bacillus sp. J33 TaxID=935836 RepID=UPI0004BC510E|nr:hypothetical protein [Bacillus sp. J33]